MTGDRGRGGLSKKISGRWAAGRVLANSALCIVNVIKESPIKQGLDWGTLKYFFFFLSFLRGGVWGVKVHMTLQPPSLPMLTNLAWLLGLGIIAILNLPIMYF